MKHMSVPVFLWSVHRTKRATGGSFGFRQESRRKGFLKAMDYALELVLKDGYDQLDTGSVLIDNAVVIKLAEGFAKKYGVSLERMTYHTLQFDF